MSEKYRYYGNIATGTCPEGHLTVTPFRECSLCGGQEDCLVILAPDGQPVYIDGYLSSNGFAVVHWARERRFEHVPLATLQRDYSVQYVNDAPLVLARLYEWGIITRHICG